MEKFTKGPWTVERITSVEPTAFNISPDNSETYRGSICNLQDCEHIDGITAEETTANAQLIAASPDLYKALKACVNTFAPLMAKDSPAIAEIRSILLKANPHYNP